MSDSSGIAWRAFFAHKVGTDVEMLERYFSDMITLADLAEYSFTLASEVGVYEQASTNGARSSVTVNTVIGAMLIYQPTAPTPYWTASLSVGDAGTYFISLGANGPQGMNPADTSGIDPTGQKQGVLMFILGILYADPSVPPALQWLARSYAQVAVERILRTG